MSAAGHRLRGSRRPRLSVGIAKADPLALGTQLDRLGEAGVDVLHLDVLDGRFAGPLAGGPALVEALPSRFVSDVHLMVDDPERHAEDFAAAGADAITIHPEATPHPHRILRRLGRLGVARGVALSPGTPLDVLAPLLDEVELVLVLTVNAGGAGETFHPGAAARLPAVRELARDSGALVSIDGGITLETLPAIAAAEPDLVVAGSAIFADGDPAAGARAFLQVLAAATAEEVGHG